MTIGWRLGGGVEMTDRSREPISENCSVRGIGVAVRVSVSTLTAHLRELLLGRDAELLLLVDDQQPQVAEFDLLAQYLVGADQDVDPPRFEVGTYLPRLLGGSWCG